MTTTSEPAGRPEAGSPSGLGAALRLRIELWIALVFMALAFAAGVVIRGMAQSPEPAVGVGPPTTTIPGAPQPGGEPPPLTEEQIQGGLPQGHPDLGDEPQGDKGSKDKKEAESTAPPVSDGTTP